MAVYFIPKSVNLDETLRKDTLYGELYGGEQDSHEFIISATRGGADYAFDGTATARYIRADGKTLMLSGTVAGGKCIIELPQACYAEPGRFTLTIFNTTDAGVKGAVYTCTGNVAPTTTGEELDPGSAVPDIDDIQAEYQRMQAATDAATAAASVGNGAFRALAPYNAYDLVPTLTKTSTTTTDITWAWDADGNCHVSGTAASLRVNNLWSNSAALPYGLEPGQTFTCTKTSTAATSGVWCGLQWYTSSWGTTIYIRDTASEITVPDGAVGMRLRLGVNAGGTVDETVTVTMRYGKPEAELAEELNERIDTEAYLAHGILSPSGGAERADLNDVKAPGYYILANGRQYDHAPVTGALSLPYELEVLRGTANTILQRVTNPYMPIVYTRVSTLGSFENSTWKASVTPSEVAAKVDKTSVRKLQGRYLALGDSLMYGAVWGANVGDTLHQCDEDLRIPTRIARAVGAAENFTNAAIGGIGYVKVQSGYNLVTQLKALGANNGLADVELITIHGGANDKKYTSGGVALGTLDAICAAIQEIIDYLKATYPKIQLVIIQPLPSGYDASYNPWTVRGTCGWSMNDFDDRVSELCRVNHVGYVNWESCMYCDTWAERNIGHNGDSEAEPRPNYTHPIVDADYALLGNYIGGKIAAYGQNGASIPEPPATDGAYRLMATVASGAISYSWEAV